MSNISDNVTRFLAHPQHAAAPPRPTPQPIPQLDIQPCELCAEIPGGGYACTGRCDPHPFD